MGINKLQDNSTANSSIEVYSAHRFMYQKQKPVYSQTPSQRCEQAYPHWASSLYYLNTLRKMQTDSHTKNHQHELKVQINVLWCTDRMGVHGVDKRLAVFPVSSDTVGIGHGHVCVRSGCFSGATAAGLSALPISLSLATCCWRARPVLRGNNTTEFSSMQAQHNTKETSSNHNWHNTKQTSSI